MRHIETDDIREALTSMQSGLAVINGIPVERRSVTKWTVGGWRIKCTGLAKAAKVLEAWLEPPRGVMLHAGEVRYLD